MKALNDLRWLSRELCKAFVCFYHNVPLRYREWRCRNVSLIDQLNLDFEARK